MSLSENVQKVKDTILESAQKCGRNPEDITLIAATKTQNSETVRRAISAGISHCGENRVQEMKIHLENQAYEGAELHFIGHLQSNKVKQVVGTVGLIHSVGAESLLREIGKQAVKQDILLEINIGQEESKTGFLVSDLPKICDILPEIEGINVRGLMAIPPRDHFLKQEERIFERLYNVYIDFSAKMSDNYKEINCLSMGMSEDYHLAIAHGSTMVRVGTAIFGART